MNKNFPFLELLLHPNIPKPLHGINPRSILGKKWWDCVRRIAYLEHNNHCWACGIHKSKAKYHKWLEAHEVYQIDYQTGRVELLKICALCHSCHNYIHDGRMQMMVRNGRIRLEKYIDILIHGEKIINQYLTSLNKDHQGITWKQPFEPTFPFQYSFPNFQVGLPQLVENKASWSDWHLVLNGNVYYSRFSDFDEWQAYYQWLNQQKLTDSQDVLLSFKKNYST